jgi:hypothetical protein
MVLPQGFFVIGDKIEPLLGLLYRNIHFNYLLYQVFRAVQVKIRQPPMQCETRLIMEGLKKSGGIWRTGFTAL